MAVGEHDRSSAGGRALELGDEGITAGSDLVQGLATGAAVAEQVPARVPLVDLRRRQPFVGAVVVLGEGVDHRCFDPGHAAASRFHRSLQRAGVDQRQSALRQGGQQRRKAVGLAAPLVDQRKVGAPCVPTVLGPFRRAVAHEQDELWASNDRIGHGLTP